MKSYLKTFAVVVVLVVVGSACSGGGAKVELVPVATELRPTPKRSSTGAKLHRDRSSQRHSC